MERENLITRVAKEIEKAANYDKKYSGTCFDGVPMFGSGEYKEWLLEKADTIIKMVHDEIDEAIDFKEALSIAKHNEWDRKHA